MSKRYASDNHACIGLQLHMLTLAAARPIPEEPPVTMAVVSLSCMGRLTIVNGDRLQESFPLLPPITTRDDGLRLARHRLAFIVLAK